LPGLSTVDDHLAEKCSAAHKLALEEALGRRVLVDSVDCATHRAYGGAWNPIYVIGPEDGSSCGRPGTTRRTWPRRYVHFNRVSNPVFRSPRKCCANQAGDLWADHSPWENVAPLLADRFTIYTMDRRGRGASGGASEYALERKVDDVVAAVEALPYPVFLYGHSFGGVCAV